MQARDINPAAVAAAAALGIAAIATPAALARLSDVLIVVVVDAAQIEAVLFGPRFGPRFGPGGVAESHTPANNLANAPAEPSARLTPV